MNKSGQNCGSCYKGKHHKSDTEQLNELLQGVSRTFALNIPMLPPLLRKAVTLSYLLFRNADTIEDAYLWSKEDRIRELEKFIAVVNWPDDLMLVGEFAARYEHEDRIQDPNHVELLRQTPFIMKQLGGLPAEYIQVIIEHVTRTARGMQFWVRCHDEQNRLSLLGLKQLDNYCYTVAGIVGEMLTTLFGRYSSYIKERQLPRLRILGIGFGIGLQLTNIIKDSFRDHREGRHYIPKQYLPLRPDDALDKIIPIFVYAYRHLIQGVEYVLCLPAKEIGIRKTCLVPLVLAAATLDRLFHHRAELYSGRDVKINRDMVFKLINQVEQVVTDNQHIRQLWEQLTGPLGLVSQQFGGPLKSKAVEKALRTLSAQN